MRSRTFGRESPGTLASRSRYRKGWFLVTRGAVRKIIDARDPPRDAASNASGERYPEQIREVNTRQLLRNVMHDHTNSHTPQPVIPLAHPFRTNVPVGTHMRLDPTSPGSCHEMMMRAPSRRGGRRTKSRTGCIQSSRYPQGFPWKWAVRCTLSRRYQQSVS